MIRFGRENFPSPESHLILTSVKLYRQITDITNRAAKIIMNTTYDHTKLLRQLNWLNVSQLIDFDTVSLTYKIGNGLVPAHSHHTRSAYSGNFRLLKRRLNIGQTTFSFHGTSLWNQLPYEIKKGQHLSPFKNL